MNAPAKLAAYAAVVAVLGIGAAAAGSAMDRIRAGDDGGHAVHTAQEPSMDEGHDEMKSHDAAPGHSAGADPAAPDTGPDGLGMAEAGYTLTLEQPRRSVGRQELAFRVVGPDGAPVRRYTTEHDKELHLIVVRRDLTGYQHLHPVRDETGTWRTPLSVEDPGPYRVLADFVPEGRAEGLTLGADLTVTGEPYEPEPLPPPAPVAAVDGYQVHLRGDPQAGGHTPVELTVTKDGQPVTDLEPYLGAYGHLVALRDGDVAYLHVHPTGTPGDGRTEPGPTIAFEVSVPTPGSYRLFLDFQHAGEVRTAEFTVEVPHSAGPTPESHDPAHAGH